MDFYDEYTHFFEQYVKEVVDFAVSEVFKNLPCFVEKDNEGKEQLSVSGAIFTILFAMKILKI